MLQQTWSHLRRLQLTCITCYEDELLSFLSRHAQSLRRLELRGGRVHKKSREYGGACSGSVIRVLWTIPYILPLQRLIIHGWLESCGNECWQVAPELSAGSPNHGNLTLLEDYCCRKARFPLPHIVKPLRFRQSLDASGLPTPNLSLPSHTRWNVIEGGDSACSVDLAGDTVEGLDDDDLRWNLLSPFSDEWLKWRYPTENCWLREPEHISDSEVLSDTDNWDDGRMRMRRVNDCEQTTGGDCMEHFTPSMLLQASRSCINDADQDICAHGSPRFFTWQGSTRTSPDDVIQIARYAL